MKLVNAELMLDIDIDENKPAVLVIENPRVMTEAVGQLYDDWISGEGDFILSEDNKQLSFERTVEVIINPFSLEFNSRRIQNKLYGELLEAESEYVEEKARIQSLIINYLDKLTRNVPYEMISNELDLDSMKLFKMFDVRIEPQCESLLEKIVEFTKIAARLLKKKLLVFVTVCNYLDVDEVEALQEICCYNKVNVLFLESHEQTFPFPVKTYIIDRDKCLILK